MDFRNSLASKVLFGRNRMPAPEYGESMLDALERRNREYDLAGLQTKQLGNSPVLQHFDLADSPASTMAASAANADQGSLGGIVKALFGGDIPKATKQINLGFSNPAVMSNFGKISPITSEETEATMNALNDNLYKTSALIRWYSKTAAEKRRVVEKLKGGLADNKKDEDFSKKELAKGTAHEKEHTKDNAKAKEIAKDHLSERADYYTALEKAKIAKLLNAIK